MTQEEKEEILDFISSNKFIAKRTDGCWFFWSGDAIEVEKIVKKIKNMARRKTNHHDTRRKRTTP